MGPPAHSRSRWAPTPSPARPPSPSWKPCATPYDPLRHLLLRRRPSHPSPASRRPKASSRYGRPNHPSRRSYPVDPPCRAKRSFSTLRSSHRTKRRLPRRRGRHWRSPTSTPSKRWPSPRRTGCRWRALRGVTGQAHLPTTRPSRTHPSTPLRRAVKAASRRPTSGRAIACGEFDAEDVATAEADRVFVAFGSVGHFRCVGMGPSLDGVPAPFRPRRARRGRPPRFPLVGPCRRGLATRRFFGGTMIGDEGDAAP